jgi:hypothetical protein
VLTLFIVSSLLLCKKAFWVDHDHLLISDHDAVYGWLFIWCPRLTIKACPRLGLFVDFVRNSQLSKYVQSIDSCYNNVHCLWSSYGRIWFPGPHNQEISILIFSTISGDRGLLWVVCSAHTVYYTRVRDFIMASGQCRSRFPGRKHTSAPSGHIARLSTTCK